MWIVDWKRLALFAALLLTGWGIWYGAKFAYETWGDLPLIAWGLLMILIAWIIDRHRARRGSRQNHHTQPDREDDW